MNPSLRSGSQATVNLVSAILPQPLMATASISEEEMMGTLIQTNRQQIQKALPQTNQNSSSSRSSSTDGRPVCCNSPGPIRQSANMDQNQNYQNSNNNNRYNNIQNNRHNSSGNQQNNRYNNNSNTPNQQQKRNNTNQQPCTHCKRANHQPQDCQACFNCGRLEHTSREFRAPRQNQNNTQQFSNVNQTSQNYNQNRDANSSQQKNTLN